jgi:hypothetical protein
MIKTQLRILPLILLLGACGQKNATSQATSEQWRADLQHLARELPRRHINAFHSVSRERFDWEVAQLDAAIPSLNDDQRIVGLMRVVALVGDGHTHLDLPPAWPRYPLDLAWFGNELRVVVADVGYQAAVGARLVGIGSVPVDSAMRLVSSLVPRGENEGRTRLTATMLLTSPTVLHGLGLAPSRNEAVLVLETVAGERRAVTFRTNSAREMADMRLATEHPPLWLQRLGEPWFTELLPAAHTVYLAFRRYPPVADFRDRTAALGRLLDESGARRIIIDLRLNGGGDFDLGRQLLLPVLQSRPAINRSGGVYVITGPGTFSAAMVNALDLRHKTNAILVGAATGARPNSYSEHGDFRLPNTGLGVSYSIRHYRFGADTDSAVVPDKRIHPTWEQFRSGRDPVMEWILTQPIR